MTFGQHLKILRIERRLSQRALAARTGLRQGYLSRVECGHARLAHMPVLHCLRLAWALGMTIEGLLTMGIEEEEEEWR